MNINQGQADFMEILNTTQTMFQKKLLHKKMAIVVIIIITILQGLREHPPILQNSNQKQLKNLIIQETIHMKGEKFHLKGKQPMMLITNHMN